MAWSVELTETAQKQLRKLDQQWQSQILDYLEVEVAGQTDVRNRGKALTGNKKELWRYRVGDYKIICQIEDAELVILAVTIGHRREV